MYIVYTTYFYDDLLFFPATLVRLIWFSARLTSSVSGTRASDLAGWDGGGEAGVRVERPGGS